VTTTIDTCLVVGAGVGVYAGYVAVVVVGVDRLMSHLARRHRAGRDVDG
jgi:hypothetical protein